MSTTHVFGWVDRNINGNYSAWSTNQATGSYEESRKFFDKTKDEPSTEFLEWFCQEVVDVEENEDWVPSNRMIVRRGRGNRN